MRYKIARNVGLILIVGLLALVALYPNSKLNPEDYSTEGLQLNFIAPKEYAMAPQKKSTNQSYLFSPYLGKSFEGFKEALAFKESRGNYFSVNSLGYLGKYQFGTETLKLIGIYNPNYFLYNPALQEKAFIANAKRNKWILRKDIERFVGKNIAGISITESGILAAAHLAGPGSVKKFLRSYGYHNFEDAYGTSVFNYMKKFSGYDTSYIDAYKNARVIL
ncbi:MAG: peptidoglycan-binding protein LysM [Bacteroidia bacterium]|nr:peptidoglycan-binding protein LysM [Bacteroidia bacterium]